MVEVSKLLKVWCIYCKPLLYSLNWDTVQGFWQWKVKKKQWSLLKFYLTKSFIFHDVSNFKTKWIRCCLNLLYLKNQNQTVYICDRKLHHKPFLLSVENEFYAFRVRNDRGSILGLHTKPVTFFSNIRSYSLRSKSYNSALFLEGFYKVWRKLCSTEYIQNVYSSFRHMLTFYIWLITRIDATSYSP